MPDQLNAFSNQEHEQPDASRREGRKIVFDDDTDNEVETLPDGRFNGQRDWSRTAISTSIGQGEDFTHVELALWALYTEGRVTVRRFADIAQEKTGKPTFKWRARVADLRKIDDAPPIKTDEDKDPTEWHIAKPDTDG
jgi:hypothetical protein